MGLEPDSVSSVCADACLFVLARTWLGGAAQTAGLQHVLLIVVYSKL